MLTSSDEFEMGEREDFRSKLERPLFVFFFEYPKRILVILCRRTQLGSFVGMRKDSLSFCACTSYQTQRLCSKSRNFRRGMLSESLVSKEAERSVELN